MRLHHPLRRFLSGCVLAAILFSQQAVPQSHSVPPSSTDSSATTKAKPDPSKATCTKNGTYVNSKGQTVKRPENCSAAPKGATARCRDGSYSFSQSKRGTCSQHGGVAKWL
jgi:resuscitation-promoting factor RpfB